jgi:hypothetical protein
MGRDRVLKAILKRGEGTTLSPSQLADIAWISIRSEKIKCLQISSEFGASLKVLVSPNRSSAGKLFRCHAERGKGKWVEAFLGAGMPADIDDGDEFKRTALILAARRGKYKVLELLLSADAEVNRADAFGLTALHGAAQCNQRKCVKLLLEHGADPFVESAKCLTPRDGTTRDGVRRLLPTPRAYVFYKGTQIAPDVVTLFEASAAFPTIPRIDKIAISGVNDQELAFAHCLAFFRKLPHAAGVEGTLSSYNLKHTVERIARRTTPDLWVSESTLVLAGLACGFKCRIPKEADNCVMARFNVKARDVESLDPCPAGCT